jgi:hypothetical protein
MDVILAARDACFGLFRPDDSLVCGRSKRHDLTITNNGEDDAELLGWLSLQIKTGIGYRIKGRSHHESQHTTCRKTHGGTEE